MLIQNTSPDAAFAVSNGNARRMNLPDYLLLQAGPDQLSFAVNNADVENTIYITTDPALNKLTFVITTNVDNTTFTPGTLVPISQAPTGTGSLLYLNLANLKLSAAEFEALEVSATGWAFEKYAPATLAMTPTEEVVINNSTSSSITISINKLTLATPPSVPNTDLNVTAFRTPPVTLDDKMPEVVFFKVLLQAAPDGNKNLYESIDVALTGEPFVVNSIPDYQVANNLSFVLKPGPTPATVPAGPDTRFFVSFVYASGKPGYGAITTPKRAADILLKQGQNASDWSVILDPGQQNPTWQLVPPDGAPIIGTGVKSIVEFNISNIITEFEPGPTLMFVQYENIPGYNDGSYYILLNKVPHVAIHSFDASPNPAYLDENGKARIRLTWDAEHVGTLMLYPSLVNLTGLNYYDVDIDTTSSFTLAATGQELSNKGNTASRPLQVTVLPRVNSFVASPQNVYYKSFPDEVALSWNVSTGGKIRLISSITGESPFSFNPVAMVDQMIKEPQMVTLVPDGEKNPIFHRSVVLSAFKVTSTKQDINVPNTLIDLLPTGEVFFTINFDSEELNAVNTIDLKKACNGLQLGKGLKALAVSPDGKLVYVVSSADKKIYVVKVDNKPGAFSMSVVTTIEDAGAQPVDIAVSPLGTQIYVVDRGSGITGSLIVFNKDGSNYNNAATVELQGAPQFLAVSPSGEYIFATNSGSNSMTVVARTSADSFEVAKTITTGAMPMDLCTSPDGKWIFVCNAAANNVMVINASTLSATSTLLSTGKEPTYISVTPSSDYLFVSNRIDKTVTLIGMDIGIGKYKVLDRAISSGAGIMGTAISPNGHQVFAASGSASAFSVLSLDTYETLSPALTSKITTPTSTAASADYRKVAIWARPSVNTKRGQGASLIDVKTQTAAQVMVGLDVYDIVYSPDKKLAFVIQGKDDTLSLHARSVTGFTDFHTIDGFTGVPNRLAVTTDGGRLIVSVSGANANKDTAVVIVDTADFKVLQTILLPKVEDRTSLPLAVTPDDSKIFIVQNDTVSILKKEGNEYVLDSHQLTVGKESNVAGILPDGSKAIVVASESHSIAVIDTKHYEIQTYLIPDSYSNYVSGLAISPDGSNIVVSDTQGGNVLMLDTLTYTVFAKLPVGKFPQYLCYLRDASALYVPNLLSNSISVVRQIQPVSATEHIAHPGDDVAAYEGMYIRKYLGQTGPIPVQSGVTISPDIIPYGTLPTQDPKEFITPENWNKDMAKDVLSAQYNNLYVRGDNNATEQKTMTLELNWSPSNLVMWPSNWADNLMPISGKPGEFSQKVTAEASSKWVSMVPFLWNTPQLPPEADHFCLVARLDEPVPTVNFSWDELLTWIRKPNVGWRNVYPVNKDKPEWSRQFLLNLPADDSIPENSKIYVFLDFTDMPAGVDVQFSCPDQQADPLIIKPRVRLNEPNEVIGLWTKLPRGFSSYVVVSFWRNDITIPIGASVTLNSYYLPSAMTDDEFRELCEKFHSGEKITHDFIKANAPTPWYYVGACHNVVME
ncbi:YncE family protein [Chitinophaga barathri]|uniref:YncE family protein n=1 Tax=Chitinophaga barathri TaxID=1647451 RepID=A0A3N4MTE1_9BACT|nr:YncE family protein [Chitinophaga barathri]RPD42789.1 YncE family protein [Chitinophaga barathri]